MAASKRASLEQAEQAARSIGQRLAREMPAGWGFILWLESFGPDGFATYLSTIERDDAIRSIEEWIQQMKGTPRTGEFVDQTARSCWCCSGKEGLVTMRGAHRSVDLCRACLATQEQP